MDSNSRKARDRIRGQIAYYTTFPYYDVALDLHPVGTETRKIRDASERGDIAAMNSPSLTHATTMQRGR